MATPLSHREIQQCASRVLERRVPVRDGLEALVDFARTLIGYDPCPKLGAIDLDKDVTDIAMQIRHILRELPPPSEVNHLFVGGYRYFDSPTSRPIFACWIFGQADGDPDGSPLYSASRYQIQSAFLNHLVDQEHDDMAWETIALAILWPASALLFGAAVRQLSLPYTVVCSTGDANPHPFEVTRIESPQQPVEKRSEQEFREERV